jgi:hypothetical protein
MRNQHEALRKLAEGNAPADYLTRESAAGVEHALTDSNLLDLPAQTPLSGVVARNREALAAEFRQFVHEPTAWGDGPSVPMLEALGDTGVDHALLLLSDLCGRSPRPDLARRAAELGFLFGPYDSYHKRLT